MDFKTITDLCISLCGRPDKKLLIQTTVNNVIRQIAGSGAYPFSLVELILEDAQFSNSGIYLYTLPERFQSLSYIIPEGDSINRYHPIDVAQPLRQDCPGYYISGSVIRIRAKTVPSNNLITLGIGYHEYPADLVNDADTNWILTRMRYLVQRMVVSEVLSIMGDRSAHAALREYSLVYLQHEVNTAISPIAG